MSFTTDVRISLAEGLPAVTAEPPRPGHLPAIVIEDKPLGSSVKVTGTPDQLRDFADAVLSAAYDTVPKATAGSGVSW